LSTDPDLGPVEIEAQPRRRQSKVQRRQAAERLLAELLAVAEEERPDRLQEERFQDPYLFELLLETGHAALPHEPRQAGEILALATGLALLLEERGILRTEMEGEGYSRALCLAGTARRLLGDFQKAEAAFERAGCLAVAAPGRGFFCRALAVLRWDQGRHEEAAALLHHAQRWYAEGQAMGEEAVCRALLGVLHVENGETWRAAPVLRRASRDLDSASRPALAAQCWLGLAFCHAVSGELDEARSARRMGWGHYRKVREEELLPLYWLEGRGAALTGDAEDAERLLDAVRRALIGRRRLPEAVLATIDLELLWLDAGKSAEVSALLAELRAAFEGRPGFDFARNVLESLAGDAATGRLDRDAWTCLAQPLRMAFRSQGLSLQPVLFA